MKCDHCPIKTEPRDCPGENNRRVCELANPARPEHRPGILAKITSFATAVVQHVAAGVPMATEEQKNARLAICQACEQFNQGSCRLCGCGLETKVGWADQECPVGKWKAVSANQSSSETR